MALENVKVLRGGHLSNLALVEGLAQLGTPPIVLTAEEGPVRAAFERFAPIVSARLDRQTLRSFTHHPLRAINQWRAIYGHLRDGSIDLVQCDYEMLGAIAPAARTAGTKVVVVLRSRLVHSRQSAAAAKLRGADAAIVLTERARDDLRRVGWGGPIWVVPNAVRPSTMRDLLEVPITRALPMTKALVVGALVPDKGQLDMLRVLGPDSGLDVVRFVGSTPSDRGYAGALEGEVERQSASGLVVDIIGHSSELAEHYAWSDVVLIPSRREGLSRVAVEAQLSGRPVVCRDFSGADDALMPESRMARVASLGAWATALNDIRTAPGRREELERVRDYARQKHDSAKSATDIRAVWSEVAGH